MASPSDCPTSFSITRNGGSPGCHWKSVIWMMFACPRAAAALASRWNRVNWSWRS